MRKRIALTALVVGFLVSGQDSVRAQAPGADGGGKLMGFVALPKVLKTIETIEAIGAQIDPSQMQPGMLRNQVGAMLGDPGFENLDTSRPVCLFVFTPRPGNPAPPIALYVPAKNASPYDQMASAYNMKATFKSGTLVAADSDENLAFATSKLDVYERIVKNGMAEDLRFFVSLEDVMASYGFLIDMGIQQTLSMMEQGLAEAGNEVGTAGQLETGILFMRGYVQAIRSLLRQSKNLQIGLSLSSAAIDAKLAYRPRSGTAAAEFLGGSPPELSPVLSHVEAPYSVAYAVQIDPARTKAFADTVVAQLAGADPKLKALLTDDLTAAMDGYFEEFGGAFAGTMGQGDKPFGYTWSATVKSEDGVVALLEKALKLYEPGGGFDTLMSSMGLSTKGSLQKNVRKSGGANVHRMAFDHTTKEEAPAEVQKILETMPSSYDVAVANGILVGSTDPAATDALIGRATAGGGGEVRLASYAQYGEGKSFYFDMNVARFVKGVLAFLPDAPKDEVGQAVQLLEGLPPVTGAGSLHSGRAVKEFRIPVELMTRLARASQGGAAGEAGTSLGE